MNNQWKKNVSVIALLLFLPSFAYPGIENTIKMGIGCYSPNRNAVLPLLVTSNDHGTTWNFAPDVSSRTILPADFTDIGYQVRTGENSLVSTSCQKNFCMAVGRYKNANGIFVPLIGLSKNYGVSWGYVSIKPEDYGTAADWYIDQIKTACNSKICVIAMPYYNLKKNYSYLILRTENQGQTWSYSTLPSELLKKWPNMLGLNCTEQVCIGAGFSLDGFLVISKDQAKTWISPKLDIPKKYIKFAIGDAKCKGNVCIAAGDACDSELNYYLLLLRSTDGGNTWNVIENHYYADNISSITYTGNTWAISGRYHIGKEIDEQEYRPFVIVSQDNGETWIQPSDIISKLPEKLGSANYISGDLISCSGDHCILATLAFPEDKNSVLALAISHDKGMSWSYTEAPLIDSYIWNISIAQLSCDDKECFVMGSYEHDATKPNQKPFIFASNDNGKTWYFPTLNIPEYVDAKLYGGSHNSLYTEKQFSYKPLNIKSKGHSPDKDISYQILKNMCSHSNSVLCNEKFLNRMERKYKINRELIENSHT